MVSVTNVESGCAGVAISCPVAITCVSIPFSRGAGVFGAVNLIGSLVATALLCSVLVLAGCGSPESRYSQRHDSAPTLVLDPERIVDAVPQKTEIRSAGNVSPYRVNGVQYTVMSVEDAYRYRAKGKASWYGSKFHGHRTSNGEVYNMYEMSAAHKTLPIPCYAKITNLGNGQTAIVRVNDRGPFHSERIIDLSYAAATKLGFMQQGVAEVQVEIIDPDSWGQPVADLAPAAPAPEVAAETAKLPQPFLQAAALSQADSAQALSEKLQALVEEPVTVSRTERAEAILYRVRIGPLKNAADAERIGAMLAARNLGRPHLVYE